MIEKRDDRWCLLTKDRSRTLGCHDSEEAAQAQERAVEIAKHTAESHEIRGVQIFRTGTWNGDVYTDEDLDAIATAAASIGFTPPVKVGHTDDKAAPAVGWVENVRRVGSALYADLVALPAAIYELIRSRGYDTVSAEIFWDLERNGQTFPRALKALALLGCEVPAVNLEPLHKFLSMAPPPDIEAHAYAVVLQTEAEPTEPGGNVKMATTQRNHADDDVMPEPDENGQCPEGYEAKDGKCVKMATTAARRADAKTYVRDGEIIVKLSDLEALKTRAERAGRIETLEQQLQQEKQRAAEFADMKREEQIAYKTREVKIPSFRVFARRFYEWALRDVPQAKIYSLTDPDKLMTPVEIVDEWVAAINKQADVLFKTLSVDLRHRGDPDEPDDIQKRIDYRVNAYCRENKLDRRTHYKVALQAVLDADPNLKAEYSGI